MKETPALKWLRDHGFRITRVRLAVVSALLESSLPLTLAELHQRAGTGDFATVFRFLQSVTGRKLARLHTWDDRQARYELIQAGDETHHHHHLICRICRRVRALDTCVLESWQKQLGRDWNYAEIEHHLEFVGTCPKCRKKNPPARKSRRQP